MNINPIKRELLHNAKVEKLLVVDKDFRLKGLITVKDIQKAIKYPAACKEARLSISAVDKRRAISESMTTSRGRALRRIRPWRRCIT